MMVAHLPAGYILTSSICGMLKKKVDVNTAKVMFVGMLASALPDFDLLYFYTIDQRQHFHHHYITHLPFFWMMVCLPFIAGSIFLRNKKWLTYSLVAFANLMGHFFLDTFTGQMAWLYPFRKKHYAFFSLHTTYSRSFLNIITNWTFAFEIALILGAMALYWYNKSGRKKEATLDLKVCPAAQED